MQRVSRRANRQEPASPGFPVLVTRSLVYTGSNLGTAHSSTTAAIQEPPSPPYEGDRTKSSTEYR